MTEMSDKNMKAPPWRKAGNPTVACHIMSLRVPLFEVDVGGGVYHGNYYHFLELGRSDLLEKIGYPYKELMNRQLHLTIVESLCRYRKVLRYDDAIEIHTAITVLRTRGLTFSQLIYRLAKEIPAGYTGGKPELELSTQARLNMVCVSFTGRVTALPEDFLQAVEAFVIKPVQP